MSPTTNDASPRQPPVLAVFLTTMALLFVTGAATYYIGRIAISSDRKVASQREIIETLERLASTLKDAETGQRGYLLTRNPDYLQPYHQSRAGIAAELQRLDRLAAQGELPDRQVTEVARLAGDKLAELAQTISLAQAGNAEAALDIVRSNRGKALMDSIRSALAALQTQEVAEFQAANRRSQQTVHQRNGTFLVVALVNLVVLAWAYRQIHGEMLRREAAQQDLRQSEAALRQSEVRYRSFVEASAQVIWTTNARGEVNLAIPAWNAYTGQSPEEASGFGWMNAIHPEDRERVAAAWARAFEHRGIYEVDYRLRRHDAAWRCILARGVPVFDSTGAIREYVGTCIDITERKQAEEALRQSEERFRALAENIPQLAWMTNADGWIFWYNRRWFEYTGTTLEQMQGWGWQAVHHPAHIQRVTERFKQALATGEPWEDTFPLRGAGGQYRWFLSRAFPIHDERGELTRWFGTNTDITDIVAAREALARHREELERLVAERTAQLVEANANLQTFAHSAAHDLRSPLRTIKSFSAIALEDFAAQVGPESRAYLERVTTAADRMERLLNDLLEYSKLSQAEIKLEKVELSKAVSEALALQEADLRARNAEVTVAAPLPQVTGHPATLVLIIANYVSNALKFVPPAVPPRIRIWAELVDSAELKVDRPPAAAQSGPSRITPDTPAESSIQHPGSSIRLFVQDNGIGIAPQDTGRLFHVFQRLHGKQEYPGTGLGLAIVRKGAERMGGRVGVESEQGKGSRFWVELRTVEA